MFLTINCLFLINREEEDEREERIPKMSRKGAQCEHSKRVTREPTKNTQGWGRTRGGEGICTQITLITAGEITGDFIIERRRRTGEDEGLAALLEVDAFGQLRHVTPVEQVDTVQVGPPLLGDVDEGGDGDQAAGHLLCAALETILADQVLEYSV